MYNIYARYTMRNAIVQWTTGLATGSKLPVGCTRPSPCQVHQWQHMYQLPASALLWRCQCRLALPHTPHHVGGLALLRSLLSLLGKRK